MMPEAHLSGESCAVCEGCCTRLEGIGVRLNGNAVLHDVNFHTHCGELTVIIGPNGAGKTTLLRAILGEIPCSGRLHFTRADGTPAAGRPRVGYVPQRLDLDRTAPVRVLDLFAAALSRRPVWLGVSRHWREATCRALAMVEAESLCDAPLGALSAGQLQRVLVALALHPLPQLLMLDEPLAGMDRAGTELFYRLLSQLRLKHDLGILLVSHDLSAAAQVADRMILLNRTILADGAPEAVLASPPFRRLFGLDLVPPQTLAPVAAQRMARLHHSGLATIRHKGAP
ncbi:MAG: metal ABC transporter ATP-binding protein [bacterium]